MSDNIIDFDDIKRRHSEKTEADASIPREWMEQLEGMPDNAMMTGLARIFSDKMLRLMMLTNIGAQVTDLLTSLGFDPDNFSADDLSVNRYLTLSANEPQGIWNGPYFDWETEGATVRVATTLRREEDGDEEGTLNLMIDILKLNEDDENWQRYTEDQGWVDQGPPADLFDYIEVFWETAGPDAWADVDEDWDDDDDEDEDWDEGWDEADDDDIITLNINGKVYHSLLDAGIERISQLQEMSDEALLKIDGIGKKELFIIRKALADEIFPPFE